MNKRKINTFPLKIAVLGHKTIPSRQGGIEIVVEELTVRMAKLGHKITVYNRNGHHVSGKEFDEKKLKEYKGIRMKYVPTIDKKGLAAMSASFFAAVAAAFGKYDVVHFHAEGPCAMLWLPKLFGKRCIATIHGLDHGTVYGVLGTEMLTEYLKVQMPYEELQNQSAGIYILAYTKSSLKNDEIVLEGVCGVSGENSSMYFALRRKNDAFMSWRELLFFGLRKVTVFCGITAR